MSQAKTLTRQQIKIALAVVAHGRHPKRNRLMLLLSHWAGMRVGEIAALRITDVIDSNGRVIDEIRLEAVQTKGGSPRTVTLPEKLRVELTSYIYSLHPITVDRPLVYSQKSRKGFKANSLGQEFKKIYIKAGIKGATSHSGRRTFITNLANKGVGARVLQSLAGHKSMATTQRYIDVNDGMKKAAVNLI